MTVNVMSFTAKAKDEVFSSKPLKGADWMAFACGLFMLGANIKDGSLKLHTEHKVVSICSADAFRMLTGGRLTYTLGTGGGGHTLYRSKCSDICLITMLCDKLELCADDPLAISHISSERGRLAFLSGAFMACCSVTDPQKEYHMSFRPASEAAGDCLFVLLSELGYPPKTTLYRGEQILYYKESETIEDILTAVGAPNCSLELMGVKVYRDIRNKANRITNAETANIGRTVASAAAQVANIRYIYEQGHADTLPPELQELVELRLKNPEASLRELGMMFREPISRSGVNHRMRRLMELADALRQKQERDI